MSKKSVLLISLAYVFYFVAAFLISLVCEADRCRIHDDSILGWLLLYFIFLIPVFIFSLITYKMREEVFRAWWRFALWFVPVIMLVTFLFNSQNRGGGMVATMAGGFDILIIGIFYTIFVITSLVKIILTYRQVKRENT
jgi:hypothetical protein